MEPTKIPVNFYIERDTTTGEVKLLSRWQGRNLKRLTEDQARRGIKALYEIKVGKEAWETPGAKEAWKAVQEEKEAFFKYISSMEKTSITPPTQVQLIQQELDSGHIPLTCREFKPPEAAKRNKLNQQAINEYLEAVRANFKLGFKNGPQSLSDEKIEQLIAAKRRLFAETYCFTYEDLWEALAECTQKLNRALNGQDYDVGYAEQKSQTWVAELALPLMEKTPENAFLLDLEGEEERVLGEEQKYTENFVVFDDASYSGDQMVNLLMELVSEMENLPPMPRKIYYVIPFMSTKAKELMLEIMKARRTNTPEKLGPLPEFCIFTSDKKIPAFSDVFPPKSQALKDLFEFELQEKTRELYKLDPRLSTAEADSIDPADPSMRTPKSKHDSQMQQYEDNLKAIFLSDKSLAFMEWKTPDARSLLLFLHEGSVQYLDDKQKPAEKSFKFLDVEFLPPYKTPSAK